MKDSAWRTTKKLKLIGHVVRADNEDPMRQVTLKRDQSRTKKWEPEEWENPSWTGYMKTGKCMEAAQKKNRSIALAKP